MRKPTGMIAALASSPAATTRTVLSVSAGGEVPDNLGAELSSPALSRVMSTFVIPSEFWGGGRREAETYSVLGGLSHKTCRYFA